MASSYDVWRKVIAMVKRIVKTAIAILVLFTLVFIYVTIANIQSEVNVFRTDYDQGAYINFVKKTYDSRFHVTGNRNRMPFYPFSRRSSILQNWKTKSFSRMGSRETSSYP